MKKLIIIIFCLMTLAGASPAIAKPCIGCSAELPDSATFCSQCMTPQPRQVVPDARRQVSQREKILRIFSFLDDYEGNLHQLKYLDILGKLPELKIRFNNTIRQYQQVEDRIAPELKILVQLFAAKFQIFEGLAGIMKNLRMDAGYKSAIIQSSLLMLGLYNNIINEFRTERTFNESEIGELKLKIANVIKRTHKYSVTSKYLSLADEKVPTNEKIMVLEISGDKAMVMHMGPSMNNSPIQGWVSLRGLEKRTTWQKENIEYYK